MRRTFKQILCIYCGHESHQGRFCSYNCRTAADRYQGAHRSGRICACPGCWSPASWRSKYCPDHGRIRA